MPRDVAAPALESIGATICAFVKNKGVTSPANDTLHKLCMQEVKAASSRRTPKRYAQEKRDGICVDPKAWTVLMHQTFGLEEQEDFEQANARYLRVTRKTLICNVRQ